MILFDFFDIYIVIFDYFYRTQYYVLYLRIYICIYIHIHIHIYIYVNVTILGIHLVII
jgi:hypothetical protein